MEDKPTPIEKLAAQVEADKERKQRVEGSARFLGDAAGRSIDLLKMVVSLVTGAKSKITILIELGVGSEDPEYPPAPLLCGEHLPFEVAKFAAALNDADLRAVTETSRKVKLCDVSENGQSEKVPDISA